MKKNEISIKISLVGADRTGKTILLRYLSNDRLNKAEYEIYEPTNGASFMAKNYNLIFYFYIIYIIIKGIRLIFGILQVF